MVTGELFRGGTLEMSAEPWPAAGAGVLWTDFTVNRILACAAVFLLLLNLLDFFRLVPYLIYSYDRSRGALDLEHNMGLARSRNLIALCFLLPVCLIADRYELMRMDFLTGIPPQWSVAATTGILLGLLLVRDICYLLFQPRRLGGDVVPALRHNPGNYIILLSVLMLTTIGFCSAFRAPDTLVRTILLWETAAVWLLNMVRSTQLLAAKVSGFSTILYLCALELFPAALLVTVVVFF
ncbi:MAG: hypothetical protein GXY24_03885 [Bacteroidales bacterium]|jgi:hypothetical protein|nr:hypothetical protein [Bacteroidales bacterium]